MLSRTISTHTPHTGCDHPFQGRRIYTGVHFNSHTPHGVRQRPNILSHGRKTFQLTHPTRGATLNKCVSAVEPNISTHTPHTGCDLIASLMSQQQEAFQLTHPTRGATPVQNAMQISLQISTHTPHTGCDQQVQAMNNKEFEFQLTHPTRGATQTEKDRYTKRQFQLTHPTRGATEYP